MDALQKIKSSIKRFQTIFVAAALVLSILACSQGYISPVELTATARSITPLVTTPPPTPTEFISSPTIEQPTSLPTFTDLPPVTFTPRPTTTIDPNATPKTKITYYTQAGDTLPSIIGRFGVTREQIQSSEPIPETGLISPNIALFIPDVLTDVFESIKVIPDSEVVYSPSSANFDIEGFINQAGGFLSTYVEQLSTGPSSGAKIVKRVALENSISPYLLLALLEYKSHWVYGQPSNLAETEYPMGMVKLEQKNLYHQLSWAVQQLSIGYYGWRAGILAELPFRDGEIKRISPGLNAGTAAVQYLFAQWYDKLEWAGALYGTESMPKLMNGMFGDFWIRSQKVEPLYPPDLVQPKLELPFLPGRVWGFTGGPHSAWGPDGALAAIDFAPPSSESGCVQSPEWVTAMAPGVIVRSVNGLVIEDLDGDGVEQTGWNIMYLHIETRDRVSVGTRVETNDKIGHPSCEGGKSSGTHTHVVRKYNGEWILAGGPMPFNLSGYIAHNGDAPYKGTLTLGTKTITADFLGSPETYIARPKQP
jgi:LasA protease